VTNGKELVTSAPITGLSHFQLLVSDVEASARWYTAALGLVPFAENARIGYVALRHRGAKVVIVLTQAPGLDGGPGDERLDERAVEPVAQVAPVAPAAPAAPADQHLDHLAFAVPDGASLSAWADHLTEIGVDHAGIALENGHPSLQLRDPDGVAIELVAP
jgi:catechol 2,3-dioxygenase-like lactoylglutathione lyase family enzyme